MLYEITVIDTDEHPPDFGSSHKYSNANRFGSFLCEAPAHRRVRRKLGEFDHAEYRMPKAVIEFALSVSSQYLTYATHDRTVLVEVGYISPKRVGYVGTNTSWTQTGRMTAFLLNSKHLERRTDPDYLRTLSIID